MMEEYDSASAITKVIQLGTLISRSQMLGALVTQFVAETEKKKEKGENESGIRLGWIQLAQDLDRSYEKTMTDVASHAFHAEVPREKWESERKEGIMPDECMQIMNMLEPGFLALRKFLVKAEKDEYTDSYEYAKVFGEEFTDPPPESAKGPYWESEYYPACKFILYESLGERPCDVGIRKEDFRYFSDYLYALKQLPEIYRQGGYFDFLPIDFTEDERDTDWS